MKKYNLYIPLGCSCFASQSLRNNRLQQMSYPLDWVVPISLEFAIDCIENNFTDFFDKEFMAKYKYDAGHNLGYYNTKNGTIFLHDFPNDQSFDNSFDDIKVKYDRRIARLYDETKKAKKILFFHSHSPWSYSKDLAKQYEEQEYVKNQFERLKKLFPNKEVKLLYFLFQEETDVKLLHTHYSSHDLDIYKCYRDLSVEEDVSKFQQYYTGVNSILKKYTTDNPTANFFSYYYRKVLKRLLKISSWFIPNKELRRKVRSYYKPRSD